MGSQRYPQHLGATTVLQTTVAAVSIIASQPLTNRAGHPFLSIVAETLLSTCKVALPFAGIRLASNPGSLSRQTCYGITLGGSVVV